MSIPVHASLLCPKTINVWFHLHTPTYELSLGVEERSLGGDEENGRWLPSFVRGGQVSKITGDGGCRDGCE